MGNYYQIFLKTSTYTTLFNQLKLGGLGSTPEGCRGKNRVTPNRVLFKRRRPNHTPERGDKKVAVAVADRGRGRGHFFEIRKTATANQKPRQKPRPRFAVFSVKLQRFAVLVAVVVAVAVAVFVFLKHYIPLHERNITERDN